MTTCSNCKYLADPDMSSVCVNDASEHCCDFVLPNDSCDHFRDATEIVLKTGEKWECV